MSYVASLLSGIIVAASAAAGPPLWQGIQAGMAAGGLAGRTFTDARGRARTLSRHLVLGEFYLQPDDPASVRILLTGTPKRVCGIDIEGIRATSEKRALISALGTPASVTTETLLNAPGGSAALLSGGKLFRIWSWQGDGLSIRFEERIRPGYFATVYRSADQRGRLQTC